MALTGEKGTIKTGENQITKIENWKLNIKANEVDVTTFDSEGWGKRLRYRQKDMKYLWKVYLINLIKPVNKL